VLALLRRPNGTTITAIMEATGWQAHSVRGFLAGVVCGFRRLRTGVPIDCGQHSDDRGQRLPRNDLA
jgi:hypothetical protein